MGKWIIVKTKGTIDGYIGERTGIIGGKKDDEKKPPLI